MATVNHMMNADAMHTNSSGTWAVDCYGTEYFVGLSGGTYRGHFIPGFIFLGWGLWWAFNTSLRHQRAIQRGVQEEAQAWYAASWRWIWAAEPLLKGLVTPLGPVVELYLDHGNKWLPLYCPDGSYTSRYVHNYQHAASYIPFIVAGLIDLLGMKVRLPKGTQQAFLALAFFLEGFLMILHKKHEPFDEMVHWLLGTTMWGAAFFVLLQLRYPYSLWLGIGRAAAVMMQGMWLWEIGTMLYTGAPQWKAGEDAPSGASAMMVPVAFAMLCLVCALCLLAIWLACQWWTDRTGSSYTQLPQVKQDIRDSPSGSFDLADVRGGFGSDSAHEHSEGSEGHATPEKQKRPAGPGTARQQLRAALQVLRPQHSRHSGHADHAC